MPTITHIKNGGLPSERNRSQKRRRATIGVAYAYMGPMLGIMTILMLIPIGIVINYSFFNNVIMTRTPRRVGMDNYVKVLSDPNFSNAVINTAVFTIGSVAAHFLIGMALALALNSQLIPRIVRTVFRVLIVLPWLFTAAIVAILWRMILNPSGLLNYLLSLAGLASQNTEWLSSPGRALLSVTCINIWSGYPFFMISLLAGLQGIPTDLYEAATVDGANSLQRFLTVTLAQLRPIIISMGLLDVIWTTQQFPLIWMTTGGGPMNATEVFSTYTYKLAFNNFQFGQASASAVVVLIFSMILAFLYARHQRGV